MPAIASSSADGTWSVVQALIAPLFDGHSEMALLALLATGEEKPGYDLVRETWKALLPAGAGPTAFDDAFNRVLHDGLLANSVVPPVTASLGAVPAEALAQLTRPPAQGLELVLRPSPARHDGRFANTGRPRPPRDAIPQ